jgi:hypothetical protein
MRRVCFTFTILALVLALSPTFAANRGINLVNALEIDRAGNTFSGTSLINNGHPLGIGERFEPGFIQNTGSRPAVLAFSNGRVLKLEAGETTPVDAPAGPVLKCVCKCDSETFQPFDDTTQEDCAKHNRFPCIRKSDGGIGTLGACAMTWVPTAEPSPLDPSSPSGPASPGTP